MFFSFYKYFLFIIPKNIISKIIGQITNIKKHPKIVKIKILIFIKIFNIKLSTTQKPLDMFFSLQDFFIRKIKDNKIFININYNTFISPSEGYIATNGIIKYKKIFQSKNKNYNINNLIKELNILKKFLNGSFITIYLSRKNYHRFHMPFNAKIFHTIHIPGHLWPVNFWAVNNINKLFCINERIIISMKYKKIYFIIIAIGATMVGKIHLNFDKKITTNKNKQETIKRIYNYKNIFSKKGIEIGQFKFGSTIIILTEKKFLNINKTKKYLFLILGQEINLINNIKQ